MNHFLFIIPPSIQSFTTLLISWNLLITCKCTDDYEYYLLRERQVRSEPAGARVDGLYSIQSVVDDMYLTARNGHAQLGPVLLKPWSDSASQLWDVTKFETNRGYNLKPLANEFNYVTSNLKNNAHAYNAWEFKKRGDKGKQSVYVIYNVLNQRCLQIPDLNDVSVRRSVQFEKCQPDDPLQHWKLNKV